MPGNYGTGLGTKGIVPNIMIKVPGTRAILSIFLLTTLGVPTNATLVFTLPQILAVAEAVKGGPEVGNAMVQITASGVR